MQYWPNSHCARQDKYNNEYSKAEQAWNLKLALNNNDMALPKNERNCNLLFLSGDQCEHFPLQR